MEVQVHFPLSELKRLERVEKDANRSRRLRIVILDAEGWTVPAVAMAVGLSRRICQRWVARYNAEGLAGLDDRRGHEPQLLLSTEEEAAFRQRIEAGPTAIRQTDYEYLGFADLLIHTFKIAASCYSVEISRTGFG